MTQDSRKKHKVEQIKIFNKIYSEWTNDNKGCINVLDYLEKEYNFNKDYWAKVARWAGFKCIKRNGFYYFEA